MGVNERTSSGMLSVDSLVYLHFAYPIVLLLVYIVVFMLHSVTTTSKSTVVQHPPLERGPGGKLLPQRQKRPPSEPRDVRVLVLSPVKRALFTWLAIGAATTFVADAAVIALHALVEREQGWWCGQNGVVYVVGSFVVYILIVLSLVESTTAPSWAHAVTWTVSLSMEIAIFILSFFVHASGYRDGSLRKLVEFKAKRGLTEWESLETCVKIVRVVLLLLLLSFWSLFTWKGSKEMHRRQLDNANTEERTGLLNEFANSKSYGTPASAEENLGQQEEERPKDGWVRPDKMPERGWYEYIRSYSLFFPYLWPSRSRQLQITVMLCFFLVMVARVANVLVPWQSGKIVDELAGKNGKSGYIPWTSIGVYIVLRVFQGNNGLLGSLRSVLWIPVSQYSYRELATAAFEHVHGLSLDFHLNKKTGEVVSALNKGGSINGFLETVTFNLLPMMVDMVIAVFYFLSIYDAYYALTLFIMIVLYMFITIRMTQTRVHQRRAMANLDREEQAVKNDSLMSYETVKYFNAENREFGRYRDAVKAYQKAEYKVYFSLQALNVSQMAIFIVGLLITCLIAAYQVARGDRDVGDFVALITYMSQLQAPLNYFGTFYRSIQSSMINAERLLELFKQSPTVVDQRDAQDLQVCRGEIQCNDVEFAYDSRHPALKGVTFKCAPGTSTALVGESGGGKSTIFRLLFRFYNLNGGNIEIDGHDVRDVTVDSLRRHIGVVPQDTILFNETIMYNLRYANPEATDEQVFDACRAACIHEKILAFPDGYESKVGERGLKLSGGEKQRIAIARTILKDPRIILLDEATAALDTDTEDHIQQALNNLQEDRTTLIIAHRLSTITKCDQILVLSGGKIAESGTHLELVERGGRYASLWKKQMKANKFNLEISRLTNKARRLQENVSGDDSPSASQSEDERGGQSPTDTSNFHCGGVQGALRGHKRASSSLATVSRGINDEEAQRS